MDPMQEDLDWYRHQIRATERILNTMDQELCRVVKDTKWPLEVR